jgi:uncharacterized membrane protein YeaQ/YmgE (transglycosylase-associated protein family)
MGLILFLIFGLIVGFLARALMPGPDPMSWWMTMLLGIAGSFVGWAIGRTIGMYHNAISIRPAGIVMSLLGALVVLAGVRALRRAPARHQDDLRRPSV